MSRCAARRWSVGALAIVWIALGLGACKHDLDELRSKRGAVLDAGSKPAGAGGQSGGKGGAAGNAGNAGRGGSGGSEPPDAGLPCGPCDELSAGAKSLNLRTCCRGALNDECGLTFGDGTLCLPRMVPSQDNDACSDIKVGDMTLAGCCRPDGRCGVAADGVGLGCVAREELAPVTSGTPPNAIACDYTCEVDGDCRAVLKGLVCAENLDHTRRLCAEGCQRDADCAKGQGLLCGFAIDRAMDRVLVICRTPVGDLAPGDVCARAEDCLHGICNRPLEGEGDPYCSQFCRLATDCKVGYKDCVPAPMESTDGGAGQMYSVCLPPKRTP